MVAMRLRLVGKDEHEVWQMSYIQAPSSLGHCPPRPCRSEVLDLGVRAEGDLLRFWDPATRRDVWHHREAEAAAVRAKAKADRAAAARLAAEARRKSVAAGVAETEARIAELEAELRRLRSDRESE